MKKMAFLYISLAGLLWGTSVVFVHFLAPYGFTSLHMTTMRGVISLVSLGLFLLFFNKNSFKIELKHLPLYLGAGFTMYLTATCYYISMQTSSPSTAVILMYTAPIFVMIYSVLFMGEKITAIKAISVIFMFIGCGLVSGIIGGLKFSISGIVYGFISGISYSAYNIFTKYEMRKNINPLTATFYCYVFMTFFALITSSPYEIISISAQNPHITILLIIGIGVFTSILPYFLYTLGLKELPAGIASSLGIIEPLAATIYSVAFFDEPIGIFSILGILLILCAILFLSRTD